MTNLYYPEGGRSMEIQLYDQIFNQQGFTESYIPHLQGRSTAPNRDELELALL